LLSTSGRNSPPYLSSLMALPYRTAFGLRKILKRNL
jgi:hypothetical protein